MVPLISTSELRTLRPLGLDVLVLDEGGAAGLLGALGWAGAGGVLAGALLEPLAADSDFCPITF